MKYVEKTKSYAHQLRARRAAMLNGSTPRPAFAYFMEMGTGKTKVDVDETGEMLALGLIDVWVIVAPKGCYRNWDEREIPTHMPDALRATAEVQRWHAGGGNATQRAALERLLTPQKALRVLVVNVEAFSAGRKAWDYVVALLDSSRVGAKITLDESTVIKNTTKRTDAVVELGQHSKVKFKRILTGSPVTRSPLDLYWQFAFLGTKLLGFSSFYSFRGRYAVMQKKNFGGRAVQIVVGYRDVEGLTEKIAPHSFRVQKHECLDLPPKVYESRDVELTDEQRRIYSDLREQATSALNDLGDHVTATEVITQILRLHQVCCGHVMDEMGVVHDVPSNRVSELLALLEEFSGKAIIWSRYRRDIEKIVEKLSEVYGPRSVVQYHGGTSTAERGDAGVRFQGTAETPHDPECRFMVSNAQTGGYGNTWTQASLVVYFSNDYDLEKRMQSEDRAHRVGQTKSVLYVDLVARGTVDEKILKALRSKINISTTVMGDGYRDWLI